MIIITLANALLAFNTHVFFIAQERTCMAIRVIDVAFVGGDLPMFYPMTQLNGFKYENVQTGMGFKLQD